MKRKFWLLQSSEMSNVLSPPKILNEIKMPPVDSEQLHCAYRESELIPRLGPSTKPVSVCCLCVREEDVCVCVCACAVSLCWRRYKSASVHVAVNIFFSSHFIRQAHTQKRMGCQKILNGPLHHSNSRLDHSWEVSF